MIQSVNSSPLSETFFFSGGWSDPKNFFKLFISGAFIAIVMTGLDQDLMQKNLTCKNIKEAQKNMFWFTITLVIVNLMFLSLGALLYIYASQKGIETPKNTDDLYPLMALKIFSDPSFGFGGILVGITFLIGITAATYASSDSALTALTTAFSIDFMDVENKPEAMRMKIKNRVHVAFSVIFVIAILIFNALNSSDVISAIYKIASYTYGPLLGLFAYGIYTKRQVIDKFVPFICLASPVLTYLAVIAIEKYAGYIFGFENLLLNGLITVFGLMIFRKK
jgi:Na+/proline symporter